MLEQAFRAMIITSCIGSIFGGILLLTEPLTKKYFSANWHYYMWIAVFITMVVPVKLHITQHTESAVQTVRETVRIILPEAVRNISQEAQGITDTARLNFDVIPLIWMAAVIIIFAVRTAVFTVTMARLRRNAEIQSDVDIEGFTKRKITVYRSGVISSPFISGIFKTELFLPETELTESQMKNILAHESAHLRRGDVLVKWFAVAVKCIHWFNPAVYFISNKINLFCEISCDSAATRNMSGSEKTEYISTVLSLIKVKGIQPLFATSMASVKKQLIKRFSFIKSEKKLKRTGKIVSVVFSVLLIFSVLAASGIALVRVNTEKTYVKSDNETVHTEIRAETVKENAPEPEMLEATETEPEEIASAEEEPEPAPSQIPMPAVQAEETEEHIPEPTPVPTPEVMEEPQEIDDDYYIGMMVAEEAHEEMNAEKVIKYDGDKPIHRGAGVADLKTHYKSFEYNFDEATTILTEVYPDRNGNITLYFDGEVSGVNAKVNISKKEDNGRGWGYSVPTDKQQIYHFCNFDPDEVYDVAISSYCPGNYNISGNVLIY